MMKLESNLEILDCLKSHDILEHLPRSLRRRKKRKYDKRRGSGEKKRKRKKMSKRKRRRGGKSIFDVYHEEKNKLDDTQKLFDFAAFA